MKLALCVSGQARDFATFVSEWHALVVRHLIASRFSQADTFLLLSEVKYCLVPKRHLPSKQARPLGHRAKVGVVSVDSC